MPSAAFNKFNSFVEALAEGIHDLENDTLKLMLTNSAPSASNAYKSDISEIAATGGYTPKQATQSSSSQTSGLYKLKLSAVTFLASGGSIGPFRYVVLFNDSATNKNLIGYYDYGSELTLTSGNSLVVTFDSTDGVLDLT